MTDGRRKVRLEEMFTWEIATAMAEVPLCYLPVGTLEWHGEHAAVGLDALKAHAVCIRVAERSGGLVVPPLYWSTDWREDLPDGSYLTGGIESHGSGTGSRTGRRTTRPRWPSSSSMKS